MKNSGTLDDLYETILERFSSPPESSYTSSLAQKGIDRILKKIGEEATEVVIAGKGGSREELIAEVADLFFHVLVLLGFREIRPDEVYAELARRSGVSGLEEKASRGAAR